MSYSGSRDSRQSSIIDSLPALKLRTETFHWNDSTAREAEPDDAVVSVSLSGMKILIAVYR